MFVLVVGGGKVGYYLTRELSESGHEVVLMEKDRGRADQIADEIGSIVVAKDGCEGSALADAGANRADVVAAVTGDDADNLVICQMAKHHFAVPKTIARVNNPKNEPLFKLLGVDELISPTRMILGSIEQDIPVHELLHLAPLSHEFELVEAQLTVESPAVGRTLLQLQLQERPPDRGRLDGELRLDELELVGERCQVQQLVDRDVLLDRPEDHPGRRDQLVHPEKLEERLVLRVVDPGDRLRDGEVVLRHLADHEVVLVVARDGGDDVRAVRTRVGEGASLAAVLRDHDRPDLIGDLVGPTAILLHEHHFVAGLGELAGQVVADLPSAYDKDEHPQASPWSVAAAVPMGA